MLRTPRLGDLLLRSYVKWEDGHRDWVARSSGDADDRFRDSGNPCNGQRMKYAAAESSGLQDDAASDCVGDHSPA
jgi:hypothetical protein